jgi:hypothetical protein
MAAVETTKESAAADPGFKGTLEILQAIPGSVAV